MGSRHQKHFRGRGFTDSPTHRWRPANLQSNNDALVVQQIVWQDALSGGLRLEKGLHLWPSGPVEEPVTICYLLVIPIDLA